MTNLQTTPRTCTIPRHVEDSDEHLSSGMSAHKPQAKRDMLRFVHLSPSARYLYIDTYISFCIPTKLYAGYMSRVKG